MHTISLQQLFNIDNTVTALYIKIALWAFLALSIVITSVFAMSDIMNNCSTYVVDTWKLDNSDCDGNEPMLLSRAITTVAIVRGLAIAMSLFGALLVDTPALQGDEQSYIHNILKYAFFCFASAFTVSMFDAGAAHTVLIVIGSVIILVATYPNHLENNGQRPILRDNDMLICKSCFTKTWWWVLWLTTVVSAVVWIIGYLETNEIIRSYWYVAEYVFFAFLLETVAFVNIYLELRYYNGRYERLNSFN